MYRTMCLLRTTDLITMHNYSNKTICNFFAVITHTRMHTPMRTHTHSQWQFIEGLHVVPPNIVKQLTIASCYSFWWDRMSTAYYLSDLFNLNNHIPVNTSPEWVHPLTIECLASNSWVLLCHRMFCTQNILEHKNKAANNQTLSNWQAQGLHNML